jgi:hypothetical protein
MWEYYQQNWLPFGELLTDIESVGIRIDADHLKVDEVSLEVSLEFLLSGCLGYGSTCNLSVSKRKRRFLRSAHPPFHPFNSSSSRPFTSQPALSELPHPPVLVTMATEWACRYCSDAKWMNIESDTQKQQLLFAPCTNKKDKGKRDWGG